MSIRPRGAPDRAADRAAPPLIVRRDPSARVLCLSDGAELPLDPRTPQTGSGPNTHTRRSHTRPLDSRSHFDARVGEIIPHLPRGFPPPVRAVAGVGARVPKGLKGSVPGLSAPARLLRLRLVPNWRRAAEPRTAPGPVVLVPALFWVGPARAERLCAAGASGEKFFLCARARAPRPVCVVGAEREPLAGF